MRQDSGANTNRRNCRKGKDVTGNFLRGSGRDAFLSKNAANYVKIHKIPFFPTEPERWRYFGVIHIQQQHGFPLNDNFRKNSHFLRNFRTGGLVIQLVKFSASLLENTPPPPRGDISRCHLRQNIWKGEEKIVANVKEDRRKGGERGKNGRKGKEKEK